VLFRSNKLDLELKKIIDTWDSQSDMKIFKTNAKSHRRMIKIPGIDDGPRYEFELKVKGISIELVGRGKKYKGYSDQFLKERDGIKINGHIFNYSPPSTIPNSKAKIRGWQGELKTDIPKDDVANIIDTMNKLIEETKDKIIKYVHEFNKK
jgi:hypothetical protein